MPAQRGATPPSPPPILSRLPFPFLPFPAWQLPRSPSRSRTCPSRAPRPLPPRPSPAYACSSLKGGMRSCSSSSAAMYGGDSTSGRDDSACPIFTNAGPSRTCHQAAQGSTRRRIHVRYRRGHTHALMHACMLPLRLSSAFL